MLQYLSPEWIDALRQAATNSTELAEASAEIELTLQQIVAETPSGDGSYYITFDKGTTYVQAGEVKSPDVTFAQGYQTARSVALGEINALDAFREGHISLKGDPTLLQTHRDVFAALESVFAEFRDQTEYA